MLSAVICPSGCRKGFFGCILDSTKLCTENNKQCDLRPDCNDLSDELDCPCQTFGLSPCYGGLGCDHVCIRIPQQWVCDGPSDCPGAADEINCANRVRHSD